MSTGAAKRIRFRRYANYTFNRVIYNTCKAYIGQLKAGERYRTLANVVTISICVRGLRSASKIPCCAYWLAAAAAADIFA